MACGKGDPPHECLKMINTVSVEDDQMTWFCFDDNDLHDIRKGGV